MRPLRILTWHVHGNYLYYLSHALHEFYLPVLPGRHEGYGGRGTTFPWRDNVFDVPADAVQSMQFDCILFQSRKNYMEDQFRILSPTQQRGERDHVIPDPGVALRPLSEDELVDATRLDAKLSIAGGAGERALGRFLAAGFKRIEPAILHPASIFLDMSGEEIRGRLFLTADATGAR